jgi:hypothetical protein
MRKFWGIFLVFTVVVAHGAEAGESLETLPSALTLADVNKTLEGRVVRVDLVGESRVNGARDVSVTADFTSWRTRDGYRRVPTAEVVRITTTPKRKTLKGLSWGLGSGAAVGALAVAGSEDTGSYIDPIAEGSVFVGSTLLGGLVGAIVGAVKKENSLVLYEAPLARYLTAPEEIISN